jgi:SAM-dependent methyltransferase
MNARSAAFGTHGLSWADRFGTWLSRRAIVRSLRGRRDLRVLELGCGFAARNLMCIEDRARALVGVDLNLSPALAATGKFEGIEETIDAAIARLAGREFDLILIISVLEHLPDPQAVLTACRDLLAADGILLINVPTWRGKIFLEFAAFRLGVSPAEEMDDHKMYYDKRDLWPLLVRAGFRPSALRLRYHKFGLNLFAEARRHVPGTRIREPA